MTTQRTDSDSDKSQRDDRGRCRSNSRNRSHRARKERVLHTRISEQLAEDIRHFADDLRVPASNLVRNVLEEVFTMVDSVSGDVGDLMDDLVGEAEGVRDRVRRQSSSRRGSRAERSRRRSSRRREASDTDVEQELRRDEAAEAAFAEPARGTHRDEDIHASSVDAEPSDPTNESSSPVLPRTADLFPDILGWQPLVLNRDFLCGRCERPLSAGESAFLGIAASGLTGTAICGRCASSSAPGRR